MSVFSIQAFKLLPTSQPHHWQEARALLTDHLMQHARRGEAARYFFCIANPVQNDNN